MTEAYDIQTLHTQSVESTVWSSVITVP